MAIPTGASVEFFGTPVQVESNGDAVAAGNISSVGDTTLTNSDNAIVAAFKFKGTFGTAPTAGGSVAIIVQPLNVPTTDDQLAPGDDFVHTVVQSFPVDAINTEQIVMGELSLTNIQDAQEFDFYIQNNADQQLNLGWTLDITTKAIGAKA